MENRNIGKPQVEQVSSTFYPTIFKSAWLPHIGLNNYIHRLKKEEDQPHSVLKLKSYTWNRNS